MNAQAPVVARGMRGLTLVELLVALTLGLLITVATIAGYLGLSEATRMAETQARMDEDAQAALSMVTTHLRMAGSNPDRPNRSPSTRRNPVYPIPFAFAVRGCDGTFANITTAPSVQDLTCTGGPSSSPDSIVVTYEADRYNTVSPSPSFEPTDCLGHPLNALPATVTVVTALDPTGTSTDINFHAAENRFYIATSAAGSPSLYCKGNGAGSSASPLVENVEDLQLTYGTVPAGALVTHSANIAGYLDAFEVTGHPTLAPLADEARWAKVASVRVCIVIRSAKPVSLGEGSAQYLKCDGSLETGPTDSHLRRAYSTTVVLRNRR
jgi:type IV pilus assembly protein PilW